MTATLTIPSRFNGPPTSANGGYAAGVLARHVDAPVVEVRLAAPPPLEADLEVVADGDGGVMLMHGSTLVAAARPGKLILDVPRPVTIEQAEAAARVPRFDQDAHPFPTCFGCGPQRSPQDAVRHICGVVPDRDGLVACPANTSPSLPHEAGALAPEVVWAALDCPSAHGCLPWESEEGPWVLGTFTVQIEHPILVGEPYAVMAWPLGGEGRKRMGGAAIVDSSGTPCAVGSAVWIALRGV